MRRNSTYKNNVIPFSWVLFLILYQFLSTIYIFLTPLIGFMICYLIFLKIDHEREIEEYSLNAYLSFAYLVFIVLNKGFYLFSGIIFLSFFHRIFVEWLQTSFRCKNCVIIAYVVAGYLGVYGTNNLIAYILNEEFFIFGWEYGLYMFLDSIIAIVVFKDRIL